VSLLFFTWPCLPNSILQLNLNLKSCIFDPPFPHRQATELINRDDGPSMGGSKLIAELSKPKPKPKAKPKPAGGHEPKMHFREKRFKSKKPTKAESLNRSGVKPKKKT
jgi:hypothetical protein